MNIPNPSESLSKVWIIYGMTWRYSDGYEWTVFASLDENKALRKLAELKEWVKMNPKAKTCSLDPQYTNYDSVTYTLCSNELQ